LIFKCEDALRANSQRKGKVDKLDRRTSIEAIEKPFGFITMAIWFFGFVGVVASIGLWVWTLLF
jgi:hypothetical protein